MNVRDVEELTETASVVRLNSCGHQRQGMSDTIVKEQKCDICVVLLIMQRDICKYAVVPFMEIPCKCRCILSCSLHVIICVIRLDGKAHYGADRI